MISYLDNASTTKVCPEAVEAMVKAMEENYGNPSSTHKMGLLAEKEVTRARETVAKALCCRPSEIVFTSGGTEADNWALFSGVLAGRKKIGHVITTLIEHDAVLNAAKELQGARG